MKKFNKYKDYNKKMAVDNGTGGWKLRVFHRRGKGKKTSRLLIKCGCCDSSIKIYYDEYGMEVNGINASLKEWRNIFLPLLENTTEK